MKSYMINLIRHGSTAANALGQYVGSTDVGLSEAGKEELRELLSTGIYPEVDMLYSSPLKRCTETAHILYEGLPVNIVKDLREFNFGIFEGKTAEELENDPTYRDFIGGRLRQIPEGEDLNEFSNRIVLGFNKVVRHLSQSGYTDAALIMHGGVIMSLLAACAFPRKSQLEWRSGNGCGYSVLVTPSLYARTGAIEVIAEIRP